jgi:hypothetical protein
METWYWWKQNHHQTSQAIIHSHMHYIRQTGLHMKYVRPKTPKHQLHAPTNISTAPSPTSLSSTGTRMAKDMTGDPT